MPIAIVGEGYGSWLYPDPEVFAPGNAVLQGANVKGLRIEGLRIEGAFTYGILLNRPDDDETFNEHIVIRKNWIIGAKKLLTSYPPIGIRVDTVRDCWIERNYLAGNGIRGLSDTEPQLYYGQGADITVDGTRGNAGSRGSTRVFIRGNTCLSSDTEFNIACFNASHVLLQDNECSGAIPGPPDPPPAPAILDSGGYGIVLYSAYGASGLVHHNQIIGNKIHDTGGSGIYLQSSMDSVVMGNVIDRVAYLLVDAALSAGGIALTLSHRCTIAGNTIRDCGVPPPPPPPLPPLWGGAAPAGTGISASTSSDCTMSGNAISGCTKYGIWLRSSSAVRNLTAVGNSIRDCTGGGIVSTLPDVGGEQLTVAHNVVDMSGAPPDAASGIQVVSFKDAAVVGNVVTRARGVGILMQQGERGTVAQNTVIDASQNAHDTYSGIRIDQDHMTIVANVSRSSVPPPAAPDPPALPRPLAGLEVTGTRLGIIVVANQFGNNQTAGIYLPQGTQPAIRSNNVES